METPRLVQRPAASNIINIYIPVQLHLLTDS